MLISVGTFNLNNLFSRFNFSGAIDEIQDGDGSASALTVRYEFTDPQTFRLRTFLGKLVKAKDAGGTAAIVQRIAAMDLDVLAVQEVEDIDTLREFNRDQLNGLYAHQVLIEGNDPRFIDVAVLSKLPFGAVTSHQAAVHAANPANRVFSRDLLEVEILTPARDRRLLTIFNTHLKSHFGDDDHGGQGKAANDGRRRQQAETVSAIVGARFGSAGRFAILGDMNDPPSSAQMAPIVTVGEQPLVDGLASPVETRPPKPETTGPTPTNPAWTHRFKKSGQPPTHELFDQIWLSPELGSRQQGAFIDRRTKHGGDGSDHDPAWVVLDL